MDGATIAETDFGFRRMDVDVDGGRIDLKEHAVGRVTAAVQHVLIGFAQRVREQLVAHEAAVHVAILGVVARARMRWLSAQASDAQRPGGGFDGARLVQEIVAQDGGGAAACVALCEVQAGAAVVGQGEGHRRMGEGDAFDGVGTVRKLGRFGLEEFAPRRRVVVKVAHLDHRAGGQRGRLRLGVVVRSQAPGVAVVAAPTGQRQPGDGGDGGQGFAAKAHGGDAFEVSQRGDLGRGVAGQRQREVVAGDAAAVVGDADELDAALLELDLDGGAARVEGVLDEFLDHRGGAFDHLAGGDLADEQVGEKLDAACLLHARDYTGESWRRRAAARLRRRTL